MYLYTPLQHLLLGDGAGGEAEAEAADDQCGVEAEAAEDGEREEAAEAEAEVAEAVAEVAEAEAVDITSIHLIFISRL